MTQQDSQRLQHTLWLAGGIGMLGALCNLLGFRTIAWQEAQLTKDLQQSTFASLIHKEHHFFANQKIGAMTSRYIDFVRSTITLQQLLVIRTGGFLLSIGSLVLLAVHSPIIALIMLGLIVALPLQVRWNVHYRATWRHERKSLIGKVHGQVADALTNNLIIRTFAGEQNELKNLSQLTEQLRIAYNKDVGFSAVEGSGRVALMAG